MKLNFKASVMDVIMTHCRDNKIPPASFINAIVEKEANRLTNLKNSNEGTNEQNRTNRAI